MDRKALPVCAGTSMLLVAALGVGYCLTGGVTYQEIGPRAPRTLSHESRTTGLPLLPRSAEPVVSAGLIEAAVPPSPQKQAAPIASPPAAKQPAVAPAPAAMPRVASRPTMPRSAARPTIIEAAPTAPIRKPTATLIAEPSQQGKAAPNKANDKPASPFIVRGIHAGLPDSLVPPAKGGNLVTRHKTEFVAPAIIPAMPPTIAPKLPLVLPAPDEAPRTANVEDEANDAAKPDSRLRVAEQGTAPRPTPAASKVAERPTPAPLSVAVQPTPTPVVKRPESPQAEITPAPVTEDLAEKATPAPVDEPATASNKREPTLAAEKLADKLPVSPPLESTPTPAPNEVAEEESLAPANEPAETPAESQPTPTTEKLAEEFAPRPVEIAPAPVELVPAPIVEQPTPAPAMVADKGLAPEQQEAVPETMPLAKDAGMLNSQQTTLPWAEPTRRSPELVAAMKRADARVLHGYDLASHGALYAARAEFIAALKIVAEAHDVQHETRRYTKAAAAGLTAIKEAGDFARQSQTLRDIDIAKIILPHVTPVLKDSDTSDLSPTAAAKCYYSYAQEQLSAAVAQEMCGSMALYAMGKVASMTAKTNGPTAESTGQTMALYRAALIAEPKNFRAANELGVLLAENGQYELARDLLIRSVAVSPQATTWKNLAAVHTRTGERNLAERAKQHALALERQGRDLSTSPSVQWVDPATFATSSPATDTLPVAVNPPKPQPSTQKSPTPAKDEKPPINVAKKSIADWLRLSPRRQ